jgi:predicted nucleic acid-binding protein
MAKPQTANGAAPRTQPTPQARTPSIPMQESSMIAVEQSRAVAEIQASILSAKHFPRDEVAVLDKAIKIAKNKAFAESALYEYTKGGKVEGLSIRAAEMLINLWGNSRFGIRELEQKKGESILNAYCHDLQTNTYTEKIFTVKHERDKSDGNESLTKQRDIYENNANLGARRLRACILANIPSFITEAVADEVKRTLRSSTEPLADRAQTMLAVFSDFGITKDQIEKRLGHKIEAITENEMLTLRKIYNAINDGYQGPEAYFKPEEKRREATASAPQTQAEADKTNPYVRSVRNVSEPSEDDGEIDDEAELDAMMEPPKKSRKEILADLNKECKAKKVGALWLTSAITKNFKKNSVHELTDEEVASLLDTVKEIK